jgi:hypothetical protein
MNGLDSVPLERLLWLVPVFFALHNAEEALFFERRPDLPRLPFRIEVGRRQFVIAVIFLTIAAFAFTYIALVHVPDEGGRWLVLGMQVIILFNAVIPHLAATVLLCRYNPGVVTGVALTFPLSGYLLRRALTEQVFSPGQIGLWLVVAPFAIVLLVVISLGIGKLLAGR